MAANSEEEPMHVEENNVESSSDASASDLKLAECIDTPITSVTPSSTSGNNIYFFLHIIELYTVWSEGCTMYDFHNSTDTLKFWTEKVAIKKTFLIFIRF